MLYLDAPVPLTDGLGIGPGVYVEFLPLTAKLRHLSHRDVVADQGIPGGPAHHAVGFQAENALELYDGVFRLGPEDPVHWGDLGDGRIALGDAVELRLDGHNAGTGEAPAQRPAAVGGNNALDRGVGDNLHVAIVAAQNLGGVVALLGEVLAAPLAEALAGHRGAVAEFGRQGLHESGAAEVAVEKIVRQPGDVFEVTAAVDEKLVVGGGIGDVKIVAPTPVELGVHPVEGKGDDGQNVGPEGALLPGGIDLAGSYVFDIVDKIHGDVLGGTVRRSQMHRNALGYVGCDNGHRRLL